MQRAIAGLAAMLAACTDPPLRRIESDSALAVLLRERVESGRHAAIVVGILENGQRRTIAYGTRAAGADEAISDQPSAFS